MSESNDNRHPVAGPQAQAPESRNVPSLLSDRVRSLRLPERVSAPSGRGSWLPWVLCLILAAVSGYLGILRFAQEPAPIPEAESQAKVAAPAAPSQAPAGRVALEAGGYIIPVQRVQVAPKVGGEVMELFMEEGKFFEKGQVLAKLDRSKYEFEYRRLSAQAEHARAEYDKLKAGNREEEKRQAEAALREAEHLRDQHKDEADRLFRSRTASSAEEQVRVESRLTQAEYKVKQLQQAYKIMQDGWRKEDIEKAEKAFHQAEAQRDSAKYDLDNTDVRAPISGTILVKRAEVGNTVRPEAFSNGLSASLCDMADLKQIEVDVDVSERDLNRVFPGQQCEIRTEAPSDTVYKGFVSRLMPEANRSKASVSVRVHIEMPDGDRHLRPEMRARVSFLTAGKAGSS